LSADHVAQLFRPDAVEASRRGQSEGRPLELSPRWIGSVTWLLAAAAAAGLVYAALARVGDYARGPAVVRVEGRLDLTAATGGVVLAVDVEPGTVVEAGQALVLFHAENETRELERLDRELELKLVRILLHRSDEETRQSLAGLRAARELAGARLAERQVVAPRAGVVRNLRIRPGQLLSPGDVVLTLADESPAGFSLVALVPGQFRPLLERGMPMRFTLDGYRRAATVVIESVGDEAVGPSEARRALGQSLGDTLPVEGALVLVRARLPSAGFTLDDRVYRFHDGMPGRVEVRVRSVAVLAMLFPALKGLFSHDR
jgi:multidrug efflux pump subunit AcrA (membrane-fusion protein)